MKSLSVAALVAALAVGGGPVSAQTPSEAQEARAGAPAEESRDKDKPFVRTIRETQRPPKDGLPPRDPGPTFPEEHAPAKVVSTRVPIRTPKGGPGPYNPIPTQGFERAVAPTRTPIGQSGPTHPTPPPPVDVRVQSPRPQIPTKGPVLGIPKPPALDPEHPTPPPHPWDPTPPPSGGNPAEPTLTPKTVEPHLVTPRHDPMEKKGKGLNGDESSVRPVPAATGTIKPKPPKVPESQSRESAKLGELRVVLVHPPGAPIEELRQHIERALDAIAAGAKLTKADAAREASGRNPLEERLQELNRRLPADRVGVIVVQGGGNNPAPSTAKENATPTPPPFQFELIDLPKSTLTTYPDSIPPLTLPLPRPKAGGRMAASNPKGDTEDETTGRVVLVLWVPRGTPAGRIKKEIEDEVAALADHFPTQHLTIKHKSYREEKPSKKPTR